MTNCVQFPSAKAVPRGNYCMVGMITKNHRLTEKDRENSIVSGGDECEEEENYDEEDKPDVHCGWFFCLSEKGLIRGLGRRMQIDYLPIHLLELCPMLHKYKMSLLLPTNWCYTPRSCLPKLRK